MRQRPLFLYSTPVLWSWHTKVITDFIREKLLDDTMSWDRRERAVGRVVVNRMLFTLASQQTAMRFEMANQIFAIHLRLRAVSVVPE